MKFSLELTGKVSTNIKSKLAEIGLEEIGDAIVVIRTINGESIVQKIDEISSVQVSTSLNPLELILQDEKIIPSKEVV